MMGKLTPTAQHIARKKIKEKHIVEYTVLSEALREETAHELSENPTRTEKNNWYSRQSQRAIRHLTQKYPDEYRRYYNDAVLSGYQRGHKVKKASSNEN